MLLAIHLLISALFLLLGAAFSKGKGARLIAGYNTSSPAERAKYDEKALCRFMGKLMFAFTAWFLVIAAGDLLHREVLLWAGPVFRGGRRRGVRQHRQSVQKVSAAALQRPSRGDGLSFYPPAGGGGIVTRL